MEVPGAEGAREPEQHACARPAYGHVYGHSRRRPSPGSYLTPYPSEEPERRRSRAATMALVVVAVVVAVGAGGAVHAVLVGGRARSRRVADGLAVKSLFPYAG